MRKLVIIALIISLALVVCTASDSAENTTNTPDLYLSETFEAWFSHTDPVDSQEGTTSGPVISDQTLLTPAVPDPTENNTEGTEPVGPAEETIPTETQSPQQATGKPTTPTAPPEETKPHPTTPPKQFRHNPQKRNWKKLSLLKQNRRSIRILMNSSGRLPSMLHST